MRKSNEVFEWAPDTDDNHEIGDAIKTFVRRQHNRLRDCQSVVGKDAMEDIVRILVMRYLADEFANPATLLGQRLQSLHEEKESKIEDSFLCDDNKKELKKLIEWAQKLRQTLSREQGGSNTDAKGFLGNWRDLVKFLAWGEVGEGDSPLRVAAPLLGFNIFDPDRDLRFNCTNPEVLRDMWRDAVGISEDKKARLPDLKPGSDSGHSTFGLEAGDIHRHFQNEYSGKAGKDLGQFFTPRNLIDCIMNCHGFDEDIKKLSADAIEEKRSLRVLDPACGTGGFLCRVNKHLVKLLGNKNSYSPEESLFGQEVDLFTSKIAVATILLSTGKLGKNNISRTDTLRTPPDANFKYDIIVTNPPFGCRQKYGEEVGKQSRKRARKEEKQDEAESLQSYYAEMAKNKDDAASFEDVYPIKTNNGVCLFLQYCVYALRPGGVCAIVLPEGELMDSKNFTKFRRWLLHEVSMCRMIKVPGGVFPDAGVKTVVAVFRKRKAMEHFEDESIAFFETTKACDRLVKWFDIPLNQILQHKLCSFDATEYAVNENLQVIRSLYKNLRPLGSFCTFHQGRIQSTKVEKDSEGEAILVTKGKPLSWPRIRTWDFDGLGLYLPCIANGDGGFPVPQLYSGKASWTNLVCRLHILETVNVKYIHYFLLYSHLDMIASCQRVTGSAAAKLDFNKLAAFEIPIPSLEHQHALVEALDKLAEDTRALERAAEATERQLKLYMEYGLHGELQQHLADAPMVRLGDIASMNAGKFNTKDCDGKGTVPFYSGSAQNPVGYTTKACHDYPEYIILVKDGGAGNGKYGEQIGLGSAFYVKGAAAATGHTVAIVPCNSIYPKYLFHTLKAMKNRLMDMANYCVGLGNIGMSNLLNYEIPLPPIEVQREVSVIYERKATVVEALRERVRQYREQATGHTEIAREMLACPKLPQEAETAEIVKIAQVEWQANTWYHTLAVCIHQNHQTRNTVIVESVQGHRLSWEEIDDLLLDPDPSLFPLSLYGERRSPNLEILSTS